jgi:P4 family phage/plasmid primase-like protien
MTGPAPQPQNYGQRPAGSPGPGANGQLPPLQLTTARWRNRERRVRDPFPHHNNPSGYTTKWRKVLAHRGPYEQFAYGTDTPSTWPAHGGRDEGPLQKCLICSPWSGLIAVDVDDEQEFLGTRTGKLIGRQHALTTRGDHFHILIDARGVPEDDWPRQGMIDSANHIKSKGFIPVPGCEHYSGERYELTDFGRPGRPGTVRWTPELIAAINADLGEHAGRSGGGGGNGGGGSERDGLGDLPPTKELLERGVDHPHDGNMSRLAARLCGQGMGEQEAYALWRQVADLTEDPADPFTADDWGRHWGGAQQKGFGDVPTDDGAAAWAAAQNATAPARQQPLAAAAVPAPVQGVVVARPNVVGRDGLRTARAARWVMDQGPLRYGIDNKLWAYQHGVWVPGETPLNDIVLHRITALLGDKYRQGHGANIKDMIRAQVGALRCDPVPGVINFRNGLLHWRESGEPLPHDPGVLSTVQLTVNWNPGAVCPAFDAFLAQVLMPGDVARMWELIGYLLMSGNPLHKIILLYGRGFNGKGTLLRVLTALLGEGSVSNVSLKALADNRFAPIRTVGKLANICGDIDATYIERTGLLKQLAGEDPIDAEHKFRDSTQFTCWAVPVFSANEIPTSSDTSYGWQQRWEVFTFPRRFQHAPGLEDALKAPGELEGIAARGVAELRSLMSRTPPEFTRTQAGEAAKAEFTAHQDPLAVWLSEGCWAGDGWTDRRHAHAHYTDWCEGSKHKNMLGKTKFYALMRERFPETRRDGWPGYAGLVLRPPDS